MTILFLLHYILKLCRSKFNRLECMTSRARVSESCRLHTLRAYIEPITLRTCYTSIDFIYNILTRITRDYINFFIFAFACNTFELDSLQNVPTTSMRSVVELVCTEHDVDVYLRFLLMCYPRPFPAFLA